MQTRLFAHPITKTFNPYSQAVFSRLATCHTAALGAHRLKCDEKECSHEQWQYHSCGNRHCPNCGGWKREEWVEHKQSELLPTAYYHVVFTLPHELGSLVMGNRKELFKLLFDSSAHALLELGKSPKYLGGETGFTTVLHTWGQQLSFHPHVHCIVSAGGVKEGKWVGPKRKNNKFLFPLPLLSKAFKSHFLSRLRQFLTKGQLRVGSQDVTRLIDVLAGKKWVVYAKAPFKDAAGVVAYLGRYTHKIAITHHRIVEVGSTHTRFRYRDYADGDKEKLMSLPHEEFLRRFEQHILPRGFVKIRSYGYLSNRDKQARLDSIREQLCLPPAPAKVKIPVRQRLLERYGTDIGCCPKCGTGRLVLLGINYPVYTSIINMTVGAQEQLFHNKDHPS
jgi:hypothetical protein